MLAKKIKYIDFDGNERDETFYFNLTKTELVQHRFSINGGIEKLYERALERSDNASITAFVKDIILKSYGEKSIDGKYFEKSEDLAKAFEHTMAFDSLFMELLEGGPEAVGAFMTGILPADLGSKNNTVADAVNNTVNNAQ